MLGISSHHSSERRCVTIWKSRHSGRAKRPSSAVAILRRVEDPESRNALKIQRFLDPGSHLALRGLAGMTNCDTASKAGMTKACGANRFD